MSAFESFERSPIKSAKHSTYFRVYDRLFSRYVGAEISFVEIGLAAGGSMFMWRDFFGAKARIIGIDVNSGPLKLIEDGFEIFVGDQADPKFWKRFFDHVGKIDILLDDGGHTFEQQIVTVLEALPYIRDGGLIVVEDTHTSYMKEYGGPSSSSFLSFSKNIIDGINNRYRLLKRDSNFEREIYSVSFLESFVVFDINRGYCAEESKWIENAGKDQPKEFFEYGAERGNLSSVLRNKLKKVKVIYQISLRINRFFRIFHLYVKNIFLKKYFRY